MDRIERRSKENDWQEAFKGFRAKSLKEVAENAIEVQEKLSGDGMQLAQDALLTKLQDVIDNKPPPTWAKQFKDASKEAYNLKYMFREDVPLASKMFRSALSRSAGPDGSFGDAKKMFERLLNEALDKYGAKGLVDQEALAKTNFTCARSRI